jgi:hypothetical protein
MYIDLIMIPLGYNVRITNTDIRWYLKGKFHRIDGPAIEYANDQCPVYYNAGDQHKPDEKPLMYMKVPRQYWIKGVHIPIPD